MNVRKPIIFNPVYTDILIKMNIKKVYSNQFHEQFTHIILGKTPKTIKYKSQSTLYKQLEVLRKEGFVRCTTQDDEKRLPENKRIYYVNWDRIIDSFIDYVGARRQEMTRLNPELSKEWKEQRIDTEDFRNKCKKNIFILSMFKRVFVEMGTMEMDMNIISLNEIYDEIIKNVGYIYDKALQELRVSTGITNKKISGAVSNTIQKDFDFIPHFIIMVDIYSHGLLTEFLRDYYGQEWMDIYLGKTQSD